MAKKITTARDLAIDLEISLVENIATLDRISAVLNAINLAHSSGDTGLIKDLAEAASYLAQDQSAMNETTRDQLREVLA